MTIANARTPVVLILRLLNQPTAVAGPMVQRRRHHAQNKDPQAQPQCLIRAPPARAAAIEPMSGAEIDVRAHRRVWYLYSYLPLGAFGAERRWCRNTDGTNMRLAASNKTESAMGPGSQAPRRPIESRT